jgi:hypothetical protein
MAKLTLTDVTSGYASTTAVNANNALVETALENTLSRDGTGPNSMNANFDMNGFNILNQGNPITVSGFNWEGQWLTTTLYKVGDVIQNTGSAYICIVEHTSGTFATDLAALKWELVVSANIPTQTGNNAKFLQTDGVNPTWQVPDSSEVSFTQVGTGAVSRTIQAKIRESVSVKDFGAIGDGTTDDTSAIQAAINSSNGYISIYFPAGIYKVTSTILFAYDRYEVHGDGIASRILFMPTANDICFSFDRTNQNSVQNIVRDLAFYSNDTTYTKTAIEMYSVSSCVFENIHTIYPHWSGAGSIFMRIYGREVTSVHNMNVFADKPIVISPIPAAYNPAGIGCDHFHFSNCYLGAMGSYPVVTIETGVLITQVTFNGSQSWIGGTYGLYWLDTTSSAQSNGLILDGIRYEQGTDSTKYLVYISNNTALQGLTIRGGQGGDRKGVYLRNVTNVIFDSFNYTSATLEALNIDSTVADFASINSFWQAGSTATITGHDLVFSVPKYPNTGAIAPTAFYTLTSNAARLHIGRTYTGTATRNVFTEVLGGGTITSTYRYTLIGNQCFFRVKIVCAGGATIASTIDTSYLTGLPSAAQDGVCIAVRSDVTTSLSTGSILAGGILTPSWTATANATYVISGNYEIA